MTRNKLIIISLTTILLFGFKLLYPFYLGITHFKYNAKTQALETSVKLFVNDLEDALKKINNKPVDLINGKNKDELSKMIDTYVKDHLKCKVNSKTVAYNFIGFEIEKDVVWIYFEYRSIKNLKTLDVESNLLYDYLKQQTNIIRVEVNANEQSTKLNCPKNRKFLL